MIRFKLIIVAVFFTNTAFSQDWEFVGDFDKRISGFYADNETNELFIGGSFTQINNQTICRITRLDSNNSFQRLGCGIECTCFDDSIYVSPDLVSIGSIVRYNEKLFASGFFTYSNNQVLNSLAFYENDDWNNFGTGLLSGGQITGSGSLKILDGRLFLTGSFDTVDGIESTSIAVFQNGQWSNTYNFPSSVSIISIIDVETYNDEIYAIGSFFSSNDDSIEIDRIAKFDGNQWVGVGNGIPGGLSGPFKLIKFQDKLYCIGRMSKNAGDPGDGIAAWDGNEWLDVGGGLTNMTNFDPTNFDAVVFNDRLYVVGDFTIAGGQPIYNIASWDGTNWCGLGVLPNTFDNRVTGITVHDNHLIISGGFWSINGDSTLKYIARYVGPDVYEPCGNATSIEDEITNASFSVFPNPASTILSIKNEKVKGKFQVYILDATGRLIQNEQFSGIGTHTLNLSGLAKGVYYCRIMQGNEVVVVEKVVKVE